jgi:uncharacterized YccA/Bax inhibitor family protein
MRTSNPALSAGTFRDLDATFGEARAMTVQGTVDKTGVLLAFVVGSAFCTWYLTAQNPESVGAYVLAGSVGGLVLALVTVFKKTWASVTAPLYALCEGAALGGISMVVNARYPGIALQAVCLTFGTLLCLLMAYRSGLIPVTNGFRLGIVAATGGIMLVYLVTFVLSLFGMGGTMGQLYGAGWIGIGFSLFVVVIAALNLVLDFDFIVQGAEQGAPKYMEWYAAFGLMVTLVWLYLEILRLLSKLRSRD